MYNNIFIIKTYIFVLLKHSYVVFFIILKRASFIKW